APNLASSIPNVFSQYDGLSIVKIQNDNSTKLVISTQISNFLATLSIRIDDNSILPETGPTTTGFKVFNSARIYMSKDSIKGRVKCLREIKDANATISLCVQSIEKMFNGEEYLKIIDNDDLNAVLEILVKQEIAESACVIFES
ncbi:hypothetical protein CU097_010444, partial [Rhizopus azygosporus]